MNHEGKKALFYTREAIERYQVLQKETLVFPYLEKARSLTCLVESFDKIYTHYFRDAIIVYYSSRTTTTHILIQERVPTNEKPVVLFEGTYSEACKKIDNLADLNHEKIKLEKDLENVVKNLQGVLCT